MIDLPILGETPSGDGANRPAPHATPAYWRSPEQLARPEAVAAVHGDEFMPEALAEPGRTSRRQFLQLSAAGVALAGLSGCRRPAEAILPYTRKPENVIEGIAQFYATAMPFRGTAYPVVAESHVGRPTKLEGNPEHPYGAGGGTSATVQAAILGLYDPDRSRRIVAPTGQEASWETFKAFAGSLAGPLAVLAEPSSSPTVARLRQSLAARFPGLRWITYRPEGDTGFAQASRAAYGRVLRPLYDFSQADVIVSLDADFMGGGDVNQAMHARTFAQGRRPENATMSRFYAVESAFTTTGAQADHRLRLKPSLVAAFASALAARLGVAGAAAGAALDAKAQRFLDALAADLAGKRAVFVAGEAMPAYVHGLALALTARAGGMGGALRLVDAGETEAEPQATAFANLVRDMKAGQVPTLLLLGVNPVYDAPAAYGFADALKAVRTSIHVGTHRDETGALATWHLPRAHFLEAWGDARAYDGTLSVVQPLIAPINEVDVVENRRTERADLRSEVEILNVLATRTDVPGYDLVRQTWQGQVTGDFEAGWSKVLHDGFAPNTAYATTAAAPGALPAAPAAPGAGVEVTFRLDPKMVDGSVANNGWLLELPDLVTKIVWDNVATMSRATAERLGFNVDYETGRFKADTVKIALGGAEATLPVWIVPGHADDTITVNMGWGRQIAGSRPNRSDSWFNTDDKTDMYGQGAIANGVGVNVAPLRDAAFGGWATANVEKAGSGYTLVSTQEHGDLSSTSGLADRLLVAEGTHAEYRATPAFVEALKPHIPGGEGTWETEEGLWGAANHPRNADFYKDSPYARNQWGTVVDLTTCTGCNACVVACNAENNIQTVGKTEVGRGREMHWLRMDRYFVGDAEEPRMVQQYLTCVHCENAPCESVCPVAATYHSPDGTNQMIYNRCVGTRYCSNNCPYKVRRYNWFNWTKTLPLTVQMQQNPDVTVRFRGVMEKCSLCVQRIREVNDRTAIEGNRAIRDGEVQTACQQACPTDAITFGDLNDPASAVTLAKRNPRRYELLAELGTRPRLSYLAKIRNPNPTLEPPVARAGHGAGAAGHDGGVHGEGAPDAAHDGAAGHGATNEPGGTSGQSAAPSSGGAAVPADTSASH